MIDKMEQFPNSHPYPYAQVKAEFPRLAPYTSTVAWMMALAIHQPGVEEIGFWGIDMAAQEEYATQLVGAHYFIMEAEKRGIKVTIPPESDLSNPYMEYGFWEATHKGIKLQARACELAGRLRETTVRMEQSSSQARACRGALEERAFARKAGADLPTGRDDEITAQMAALQSQFESAVTEKHFLQGAVDDLEYIRKRWPQ